ncbi:hypothetical protein VMCG_05222 [Cytospora schulzeri]|uniref:Carboxylesterase type B domain-containing protein n=1 Tax=Cytospora schulzeri TaxID=448051 RepID=A0A423WR96_9PEZI|nr:hypothetical protein VMCG_05222 [Valsa malicola]
MPTLLQATVIGLSIFISAIATEPVVELERSHVAYLGVSSGPVEHFHNIRYAHDTSGDRRFAPPERYVPPEGSVLDATTPGPACPQSKAAAPPVFAETPNISEDCLNLRISRPAGTSSEDRLPVIVHVYTGGLVRGSAEDPHWDPDNLTTLSTSIGKPVIYVALNFRLSIFGYARLPILKDQKSLNVGMRDQREGLKWVKDNIAAFGGDPESITAFGLSAGGTMTSLHFIAFGGEQGVPFTQAWAMSGPPGTALNITSDATEIHTRAVAEKLGCGLEKDEDTLRCLKTLPMSTLLDVSIEYSVNNHPPMGLFTFIPSVDGDILPDRPSVLYRSGRFSKGIPVVFGWTEDDGATNAGPAHLFQEEDSMKVPIRSFAHALTDEDYSRLFSLYPVADFEEEVARYEAIKTEADPVAPVHWFRVSRILRDMLFTCSSIDFGYEMSRQSRSLDPSFSGVRFYDLNQSMLTPMFKAMGMAYVGTPHGSDYNYISNGVFPEGRVSEEDKVLSESMASSFIHFAYTGNPTVPQNEGFRSWPEAFPRGQDQREFESETREPSMMNIQLIGGPLGTGPCQLRVGGASTEPSELHEAGSMQIPLGIDGVEFGEMVSPFVEARKRELERQRIFQRCGFINTLTEKLDI